MKRIFLLSLLAIALTATISARNTTQQVAKVTEAMSLTDDVDLHITSAEPFGESGSIDIVNTEHAVVIFDALRPSKAKALLSHITINGEAAVDNRNCQLKLYNRGAIILPYGGTAFRPLTVFEEAGFGGESENNFTEGHSGGFMKNVPTAWNNRIKSFKLKRGYMVTFALKKSGYGYSRCFIAADEDLEMDLPELMAGRISSFRLFKWYDCSKVGVADWLDNGPLTTLNAQTSFTWGPGKNMLPDVEVVPHHIDESWPSAAECGQANYSPHLKANNEPRNEADHGTWTMEQILNNWQDMMRTGMRLCTPSSWDGSDYWNATGFLADFLNEIDKRGWRCDIIDLHGYWNEGSFTTNVNNWAQTFKRPVWITEWVWGSSWGNNGIFGEASNRDNPTPADLQKNKTVVSRILDNLNNNPACERYFYWNGEANCSKIMRDGQLTPAGEYFATMKTNGPGYTGYGNYVPKAPPMAAPTNLTSTFNVNTMVCTLKWESNNGDLSSTVQLRRRVGSGPWEVIAEWTGAEIEDKTNMSYTDNITEPAAYEYQVLETGYNNQKLTSNSAYNILSSSEGTADVQFGTVTSAKNEEIYTFFAHPFDEEPIIILGNSTYNAVNASENLMTIQMNSSRDKYALFKMRYKEWESNTSTASSKLTSNFIALKPGRGKLGNLDYEAGRVNNGSSLSCKQEYEVTFSEPFESTPVVLCMPRVSNANIAAVMWRVYDVTPEGFKVKLLKESNVTNVVAGPCSFVAFEKGQGTNGEGIIFTVGDAEFTFSNISQTLDYGYELTNPRLLMQLQTNNDDAAANLRYFSVQNSACEVRMIVDKSDTDKVLSTNVKTTERVGFIVISEGELEDHIQTANTTNSATDFFTPTGIRIDQTVRRGLYITRGKKIMVK